VIIIVNVEGTPGLQGAQGKTLFAVRLYTVCHHYDSLIHIIAGNHRECFRRARTCRN